MVQTMLPCSMEGGNAVFKARALLATVYGSVIYNNRELCNRVGIEIRQQQEEKKSNLKVYPNPADAKVYLEFLNEKGGNCTFTLTNTLGQEILSISFSNKHIINEFSSKSFLPGIYYYRMCSAHSDNEKGKLIIIH